MAKPQETLKNLRDCLATGGLLCLTTPNGDYLGGKEPSWNEVKDQPERNLKLANNLGNHVCEFTFKELKELVQESGFCLLEHKVVNSHQISRNSILRRLLPERLLWSYDGNLAKRHNAAGKSYGKIQILVAQRVH